MTEKNKGSEVIIIQNPSGPRVSEKGVPIIKVDIKIPEVKPPKADK